MVRLRTASAPDANSALAPHQKFRARLGSLRDLQLNFPIDSVHVCDPPENSLADTNRNLDMDVSVLGPFEVRVGINVHPAMSEAKSGARSGARSEATRSAG